MSFEVYRKRTRMGANRALVRIGEKGDLTINAMAIKCLRDASRVILLYDRTAKSIGLKATDDGDENGFALSGPGPSKTVNTRSFVGFYKLENYRGKVYGARYEDGMLVVSLNGQA